MATTRGRGAIGGYVAPTTTGRGGETVGGISTPPSYRTLPGAGSAGWFDFSHVPAWRMAYTIGAAAYLGIFHFSLPGGLATVGRGGGSLPHGHGMAVALYVGSWLIVLNAAADIIAYSFPDQPAAAALHQAL